MPAAPPPRPAQLPAAASTGSRSSPPVQNNLRIAMPVQLPDQSAAGAATSTQPASANGADTQSYAAQQQPARRAAPGSSGTQQTPLCVYHQQGHCQFGSSCRFRHDAVGTAGRAPRPSADSAANQLSGLQLQAPGPSFAGGSSGPRGDTAHWQRTHMQPLPRPAQVPMTSASQALPQRLTPPPVPAPAASQNARQLHFQPWLQNRSAAPAAASAPTPPRQWAQPAASHNAAAQAAQAPLQTDAGTWAAPQRNSSLGIATNGNAGVEHSPLEHQNSGNESSRLRDAKGLSIFDENADLRDPWEMARTDAPPKTSSFEALAAAASALSGVAQNGALQHSGGVDGVAQGGARQGGGLRIQAPVPRAEQPTLTPAAAASQGGAAESGFRDSTAGLQIESQAARHQCVNDSAGAQQAEDPRAAAERARKASAKVCVLYVLIVLHCNKAMVVFATHPHHTGALYRDGQCSEADF